MKDDTTEVKDEGVLNRVEDLGLLEVLNHPCAGLLEIRSKVLSIVNRIENDRHSRLLTRREAQAVSKGRTWVP